MGHGMRGWRLTVLGVTLTAAVPSAQYRTLDDRFAPPRFDARGAWDARAGYLREHVLASAGLLPLPEKTPLRPVVFDEIVARRLPRLEGLLREPAGLLRHRQPVSPDRRRSVPGHPVAARALGVRPAREHRDQLGPGRAISLARQGFVVFTLRHDRLQRQPPAAAHLRRAAREPLGAEPGRPAALEQHPRARLPRDAARRAARRASARPASRAAARRRSCSRRSTDASRWRRRST